MSRRPSRGSTTTGTSPTKALRTCIASSTCHMRSCLDMLKPHYVNWVFLLVAKEVELEYLVKNIGAKLVSRATAKTNDLAGNGMTSFVILSQGMISEGVKIVADGANEV
ncbi:hypothetical protein QYE76_004668 [Lolium multiflorum]|uniref:Uncharacterized protein n=1 Tax=Lolium multiflorum TaxID=4521 RepID=A0AAD8RSG8_LOLMU|nr:hypothetical protein QYE76_004667 [Lolium multiflorum]KAK1630353.1 hypothetical protein QYE76_004668 [Lolium multiflorum]